MSSGDLFKHVGNEFGSERSWQRAISNIRDLIGLGPKRHCSYALARCEMPPSPAKLRGLG